MSLARTLRLRVKPGVRPETLALGPQEYFVLSRIEGQGSVAEIIGASGLGAAETEQILERLLELGALERENGSATKPSPRRRIQTSPELRSQAADRRRRLLRQQLGAQVRQDSGSGSASTRPRNNTPTAEPASEAEPTPNDFVPPLVAPDDERLDASLGLPVDTQRHLLALEDRRAELSPFDILSLHPTDDLKVIRSAFRDASRTFHPDAYHGRELGRFREVLAGLFAAAKTAYQDLQKSEVRQPLVAQVEAERLRKKQLEAQREAAARAAEELRLRREQEQRAERRAARDARRNERQRQRIATATLTKVQEHLAAATEAEGEENYARAANNYRLALQLSPDDPDIRRRWEDSRQIARQGRAKGAFARACSLVEVGHFAEALPLFLEAADADPTLEHLAHAADAVREQDVGKARDLAMRALQLLTENETSDAPLRPNAVADLRMMVARAFLAAGQGQSAREQALLVQRVRPKDPQARALLKSIKVT
ncbi:MAG: J domain-containing protein [Myxococcota bacterium]